MPSCATNDGDKLRSTLPRNHLRGLVFHSSNREHAKNKAKTPTRHNN